MGDAGPDVRQDEDMPIPYERPVDAPAAPAAPRLVRPVDGRQISGVCIGLAEHLGLPVRHVRLAFVVLAFFGGAGVLAYVLFAALVPGGRGDPGVPATLGRPVRAEALPRDLRRVGEAGETNPFGPPAEADGPAPDVPRGGILEVTGGPLIVIGGLLAVIGVVVGIRSVFGLDLGVGLIVPVLTIGSGVILAWSQLDEARRAQWLGAGAAPRGATLVRIALGALLAIIGIVVLATRGKSIAAVWDAGLAVVAVLIGAVLIAAPWVLRLWNQLRAEQLATARANERADIAAHLHDSVLQTLALIQKKSADPTAVAALARAQERELRSWLYAPKAESGDSLATALHEVVAEVEDRHGVSIEFVMTGDVPLDPDVNALVRALREALTNAAKHGRAPLTAYVEASGSGVEAFVRDRGDGFDPATVPGDRHGVRDSIVARMERHGGTAKVRILDQGTEVALTLPAREGASA
jgi:signal transduction histidine kinase/phage shock protein PspC (stress-responsive transcriptional regulator)